MAITAEDIKVLNVDGTPHVVGDLPDNIQRLVEIYNSWRQDEIAAKLEMMKIEGAMRNLSGEIIQLVRAEMAPPETPTDETPTDETPTDETVAPSVAAVEPPNVSELDEAATVVADERDDSEA